MMAVCSCHVTYAFQSDSTLYSCLNVKELLAWSRHEIWSLSDCNWSRTQNHLLRKRTLNHLAKLALWPNGWMFVYELSDSGFDSSCSHLSKWWFCLWLQNVMLACQLKLRLNMTKIIEATKILDDELIIDNSRYFFCYIEKKYSQYFFCYIEKKYSYLESKNEYCTKRLLK